MANTKVRPINLKFPLERASRGVFAVNLKTEDAINDNLHSLLLTNWGDRPMLYDFGANLISVLFEPEKELINKAATLIKNAVNKWMPAVSINEITITPYNKNNKVESNAFSIKINWSVNQINGAFDRVIKIS